MFPSPAVVGDQLLIASCAGWFYALDRATGDVNWRFDIKRDGASQFHCEMLVLDDRVIIGTDGTRGNAHALDLATGDELWTYPCGSAQRTDLMKVGDTVIGVAKHEETNDLFCLRISDGHELWTATHKRGEGRRYGNSPVLIGDQIYYGADDGHVYAYSAATGEQLADHDVGGPVVSPLLATSLSPKRRRIYGGTANRIFRLNLETGQVDAEMSLEGNPVGRPARIGPAGEDDEASIAVLFDWRTQESKMVVLDTDLTTVKWQWTPTPPQSATNFGTIARIYIHDNAIIIGTRGGDVHALNITTGEVLWHTNVESAVRSITFHHHNGEDIMYVGTIPGKVHAIRMEKGTGDRGLGTGD